MMAPASTTKINAAAMAEHFAPAVPGASIITSEISQVPLAGVGALFDAAAAAGKLSMLDVDVPPSVAVGEAGLRREERELLQRQSADTDEPALDTLSALPVYTKRSAIPGVRGDGAFAARDLLEGEVIGEYAGEIVCDAELAGARGLSRYVFDLGDGLAVDARTVWVLPGG